MNIKPIKTEKKNKTKIFKHFWVKLQTKKRITTDYDKPKVVKTKLCTETNSTLKK